MPHFTARMRCRLVFKSRTCRGALAVAECTSVRFVPFLPPLLNLVTDSPPLTPIPPPPPSPLPLGFAWDICAGLQANERRAPVFKKRGNPGLGGGKRGMDALNALPLDSNVERWQFQGGKTCLSEAHAPPTTRHVAIARV